MLVGNLGDLRKQFLYGCEEGIGDFPEKGVTGEGGRSTEEEEVTGMGQRVQGIVQEELREGKGEE